MPKFMLVLRADVTADHGAISPEDMQKVIEGYQEWAGKLAAEGRFHDGSKLTDEGGRVMIPDASGSVTIKDGPYQETKEVVGGFYLISADNYDHAAELCSGHPNFQFGSVEIREIDDMGQEEG